MSNSGLMVKCQFDRVLRRTLKLRNGTSVRWGKRPPGAGNRQESETVRVRDSEGLALLRLEEKDCETYK